VGTVFGHGQNLKSFQVFTENCLARHRILVSEARQGFEFSKTPDRRSATPAFSL
jgi:hypothetical protein